MTYDVGNPGPSLGQAQKYVVGLNRLLGKRTLPFPQNCKV